MFAVWVWRIFSMPWAFFYPLGIAIYITLMLSILYLDIAVTYEWVVDALVVSTTCYFMLPSRRCCPYLDAATCPRPRQVDTLIDTAVTRFCSYVCRHRQYLEIAINTLTTVSSPLPWYRLYLAMLPSLRQHQYHDAIGISTMSSRWCCRHLDAAASPRCCQHLDIGSTLMSITSYHRHLDVPIPLITSNK